MPEGEGYQPTDAELKLGDENLESLGITEETTERGIQHVQDGRVINRVETYDNTQVIHYTYPEDSADPGAIENSKITAGEKEGQEYKREHPMTEHPVRLTWTDPKIGVMDVTFPTVLETLGQTVKGGRDGGHEPYARFFIEDRDELQAFASLDRPVDQPYAILKGELGGDFEIEVNGRRVTIERIGQVSVDYGPDGQPSKATIHKIIWSEIPVESK